MIFDFDYIITNMRFSELLEKYRVRSNLDKTQLGKKVGLSPSYIMMLESGDREPPPFATAQELCKELRLNSEESQLFFKAAYVERIGRKEQAYKDALGIGEELAQYGRQAQDLPKEIRQALNDPAAVEALLLVYKGNKEIKESIAQVVKALPDMDPAKRQAILTLCS